jgi:hypothetical protein
VGAGVGAGAVLGATSKVIGAEGDAGTGFITGCVSGVDAWGTNGMNPESCGSSGFAGVKKDEKGAGAEAGSGAAGG